MTNDYAWVWWDCDAEAWVIECWACGQPPTAMTPDGLSHRQIEAALLFAAGRHNEERHANHPIMEVA